MAEFNKWECTDYDSMQYGRLVGYREYEFWEVDEVIPLDGNETNAFVAKNLTIVLDDYSLKEITDCITGYYDSLSEICESYGTDYDWIIAECLFEQSTTFDADFCTNLMSEQEARNYISNIIEGRDDDEAKESCPKNL